MRMNVGGVVEECVLFFFQAEDGIRDIGVTGVQTCALPILLNHVLLHQTIIGEETLLQFAKVGETPDVIVGCTGGGSNFGGLAFPFLREKLAGRMAPVIRAVEPAACPALTRGTYPYDYGDTGGFPPPLQIPTPRPHLLP